MIEVLTLAMAESIPGSFQVIVLKKKPTEIISIRLDKEDIISESGTPFWDIGYVTEVEYLNRNLTSSRNITYNVSGRIRMKSDSKIGNFRSYFNNRSRGAEEFFNNSDSTYGIARVEQIVSLSETINHSDRIKDAFRMELVVQDVPIFRTKNILNKDYRWKKYWQKMYDTHHLEETKERYIKLFNEAERDLYIILYRHQYDDRSRIWIAGIHWL